MNRAAQRGTTIAFLRASFRCESVADENLMFPPRRILLACDFSPIGEAALNQACRLAEGCQAELLLLHVPSEKPRGRRTIGTAADDRRHAEERLMRLLDAGRALKLKILNETEGVRVHSLN